MRVLCMNMVECTALIITNLVLTLSSYLMLLVILKLHSTRLCL